MDYLAFDLEIAKAMPDSADWHQHRPLGICCASTCAESEEPRVWYGREASGSHKSAMDRTDLIELLEYLESSSRAGKTIVTWNGLGFDFDVLADEAKEHERCCKLARAHVDMMFYVLCEMGYPIALDVACKGMGLSGKLSGVEGSEVPAMWQRGEHEKVIEYAAQDAKATLELAVTVGRSKSLRWQSRAGNPQALSVSKWPTVEEALRIPEPDVSWMSDPLTRDKFTRWMK